MYPYAWEFGSLGSIIMLGSIALLEVWTLYWNFIQMYITLFTNLYLLRIYRNK